jgi:hypothetical protein
VQAAKNQALRQFAQNLGKENPLKINSLHDCESLVTAKTARHALIGALVEFSTRVPAGFARG